MSSKNNISSGEQSTKSRIPPDNPFLQQKLSALQHVMTPIRIIILFFSLGLILVPSGVRIRWDSEQVYENIVTYDQKGSSNNCAITSSNQGKTCQVAFQLNEDIHENLYLYYQVTNFYQNNRRYVSSQSIPQLQGTDVPASTLETACIPLVKEGNMTLNPCGLIANTFFTDIITLSSSTHNNSLDESGIAWTTDSYLFQQPKGFKYAAVNYGDSCSSAGLPNDCKQYQDPKTLQWYNFYYPNDEYIKYLYEMFPNNISPIDGVTDKHFKVWMKSAALPRFRKLYAKIQGPLKKGDILTFHIIANYEVASFSATKSLVLSTQSDIGKNVNLGISYIVVGSMCFFFGFIFLIKQLFLPRKLGDERILSKMQ